MTDNTTLPIPSGSSNGDTIRSIDRATFKTQVVQLDIGGAGAESLVTGSMPVTVGNFPATQPVSGTVTVGNPSLAVTGTFWQATQPVSIAASVAVTGPLTDAQLRATAVPVSLTSTTITGTVAATQSGAWTATVTGAAASGAAKSGNPVQIGGVFNTTPPTVTTGQAVEAQYTARGTQIVTPGDGTNNVAVKAASTAGAFTDPALMVEVRPGGAQVTAAAALADAFANPTVGQRAVLNSVFNGTTWDRQRGMGLASTTGDTGAKTATGNGATQTNVGNKGVCIVVNMGAVTGTTPTCTIKVQASLDGGTTWYDLPGATTAAITATGVYGINIYPGAPTVAGTATSITGTASCGQPLPRTWRVVWTIGGTTPSFTITNIQYTYVVN